jgi:predicted ferric reductase
MEGRYGVLSGYIAAFGIGAVLTFAANNGTVSLYTVGKVMGVWALTALTFQVLLVTRMDWLDAVIGYDRITRWHAANGMLILVLVLMHPPIVLTGIFGIDIAALVTFITTTPTVWLGDAAVILLIIQILTTLYWDGLDYEHWRIIHRIGYIVVALGFAHSFILGTDIGFPPTTLLGSWWLLLAGVAAGSVGYRYGYRVLRKRHRFRIADVRAEANNVHTIELLPEDQDIEHTPGQFAFVTFKSVQVPAEEHHFTIASAPGQEGFEYTIKAVGDFTEQVETLEEGDIAIVEGPYGRFTLDPDADRLVMVAGGIGITPLMSMLRYMDETDGIPTHLFYGNRTRDDIAFADELAELDDRNDWLTVTHVLSDEDVDGYDYGFIDADTLTGIDTDASCYVCGPPPMMDAVEATLTGMGVDPAQIKTERFSLRDVDWDRMLPFR